MFASLRRPPLPGHTPLASLRLLAPLSLCEGAGVLASIFVGFV